MAVMNYIVMNENKLGENWVNIVQPDNIQRSTKRIVKEIAKGQIDYEKQGKYFQEMKFIENLIIGIYNELEINTLNYNACSFYFYYYPQTPNLAAHINHLERCIYIYNVILERLQYVKSTNNVGYMVDVQALLLNEKKHIENL